MADISNFVENLYCEVNNLRVLCANCHSVVTLMETHGLTFEEAEVEKEIIAQMKDKNLLAFLKENGYTGSVVSNIVKRKALVTKIIKEKYNEI